MVAGQEKNDGLFCLSDTKEKQGNMRIFVLYTRFAMVTSCARMLHIANAVIVPFG